MKEKKEKVKENSGIHTSIKSEKEIAYELANMVHSKFDRLVRASILFGSQAKGHSHAKSDIDIIFIIDDSSIDWDLELISWYREELGKIINAKTKQYDLEFHINTVKLTTWWEDMVHGDPVVINILRYGEPLIDSGSFFTPLKALLLQGKLKATPEAAYAALQRAPNHLARSKASQLGAIEGIYWTMIDAAQAALITAGKLPPSPEHMQQMLKEEFVDKGLLKEGLVRALRDIYVLHKSISHGEVFNIRGVEIDKWQDTAETFLSEMVRIIDILLEQKKT